MIFLELNEKQIEEMKKIIKKRYDDADNNIKNNPDHLYHKIIKYLE